MFFILHLSLYLTPVVIRPNLGHSSKGWETLVWTSNSSKFTYKINPYVPWIRNTLYMRHNIRDNISPTIYRHFYRLDLHPKSGAMGLNIHSRI